MFSTFFGFELKFWLRGMMVYVFLTIIGLLIFAAASVDEIQVGSAIGNTNRNAPFVIQSFYGVSSVLACLMVAAFVNGAASRDFAYNTHQLIFTKPMSKLGYLMGRFWGATLIAVIPMLGTSIGIILAGYMPWIDASKWGPVDWNAHMWGILTFAVPNAIFISCIVFAIASFTRNTMAAFLGIIVLIVATGIANTLVRDLDNDTLAAMVNPFGLSAFNIETRYWTVADKNSLSVTLLGKDNLLMWNRLLWVGIGLVVFAMTCWRFKFTTGHGRLRRLLNEGVEELRAKFSGGTAPESLRAIPSVRRDFGLFASFRNIVSQAKVDFIHTLKSPVFILVTLFGLINTFMSLLFRTDSGYGLESLPVTYSLVDVIRGSLYLFLIAVTTFYAGVMVWKERDAKLDEVYDALPHATWVSFFGKLLALMGVIFVTVLCGMLTGMLYQMINGYTRFQAGLYVQELFLHDMVQLFCFAVLALIVHVVSPNKYIGYFGFIILVIVNLFIWQGLEIQSNMLQYAQLPSYTYSDMFLFAPFAAGINWFGAYWVLFAILLCFAAVLLWKRGRDTGFKRRIRGMFPRWVGGIRLASLTTLVVWAGVAAWVYNNTQIMNSYASADEQTDDQERYEKDYKADEKKPQPRVLKVRYDIDIYPERRALTLKGDQVIANKHDVPIETMFVLVGEDYEHTVDIEGATLASFDEELGYQTYKFEPALQPGEERRMQFTTSYEPEGFENSVKVPQIVQNGTFFNNSITPQIGYQPGLEITDRDDREERGMGEPTIALPLDPDNLEGRRNTYISNNSDWVEVETFISTSESQIAIAPGSLRKMWKEDGRSHFHYKVDHPSLNFYSFISAEYEVERSAMGEVDIEVYYHKDHHWNVGKMVRSMKKSLEYYAANFGPYKHKQARIIEFPRIASFAQAFPGTMPYSEGIGFIAKIDNEVDDIDMVYYVVAHEMAHQWWAHQVIGANMRGTTLLSETLAQYSALMVMEKEYGRNMMRKFLRYEMNNYLSSRGSEQLDERPLMEVEPTQGYVHYRKGSVIMYCLKELIGEDKVNAALRTLIDKFAYNSAPYPTSVDLVDALREQAPEKYQGLITDMFEKITLFGNRTTEATYVEKKVDGKTTYDVTIKVDVHKFHANAKGFETESKELDEWIEIGAFADPGANRYGKTLHRELIHITKAENTFTFTVDEIPYRVGIDPFSLLIDRVPADNMRKPVAAE